MPLMHAPPLTPEYLMAQHSHFTFHHFSLAKVRACGGSSQRLMVAKWSPSHCVELILDANQDCRIRWDLQDEICDETINEACLRMIASYFPTQILKFENSFVMICRDVRCCWVICHVPNVKHIETSCSSNVGIELDSGGKDRVVAEGEVACGFKFPTLSSQDLNSQ